MSENEINCLPRGAVLKGKAYQYRIDRVLGQGSFGITYLATVKIEGALGAIDASVAVKEFFMKDINGREGSSVTNGSQHGLCEEYKRKFVREARNLSRLKHPNIVRVVEALDANGTVYYAMEYIRGGSLDDHILSRGRLKEQEAVQYAREICSALKFMHMNSMLHLDLKPLNIMLRDGHAVLIDFGLSKQYNEAGEPESSTKVGGGTPGYAPLEQASYRDGKGFPMTMDIYALGGTMYKMLTGRRPPEAADILNFGFPSADLQNAGVSPWLVSLIKRCMSTTVKDRPQTAAEVLKALEQHTPTGEETVVGDDEPIVVEVVEGGKPEEVVMAEVVSEIPEGEVVEAEPEEPEKPEPEKPEPEKAVVTQPGDTKEEPVATPPPSKSNKVKWIVAGLVAVCVVGIIIAALIVNGGRHDRKLARVDTVDVDTVIIPDQLISEVVEPDEQPEEPEELEEKNEEEVATSETEETQTESKPSAMVGSSNATINGHEYVNLGLSVKWATCNVGASSPSEYGNYYAWGETSTKSEYSQSNSKTYNERIDSIAGNPSYDAARANWGGTWRMPTEQEIYELLDKCQWTWTNIGGHAGYKVTGPSGNSIFLPAAGYRHGTSLSRIGTDGYYMCDASFKGTQSICNLNFSSSDCGDATVGRNLGQSVRPVSN